MKATNNQTGYEVPLPADDTYIARCYSMVHIGTVENDFKGNITKKEKIFISFELPTLLTKFSENGKEEPFVVSLETNLSTNEKANLSKMITQWRGTPLTEEERKSFDPSVMVGKIGYVQVSAIPKADYKDKAIAQKTNNNSYLKFNGIMKCPAGVAEPPQFNPYFVFDWDQPFDMKNFVRVPKFLQKKMISSDEFVAVAQKMNWTEASFKKAHLDAIIELYRAGEWLPGYARREAEEELGIDNSNPGNQSASQANVGQPAQQAPATAGWGNQGSETGMAHPAKPAETPQAPTPQQPVGGNWLS